jgi:hypothetical protein
LPSSSSYWRVSSSCLATGIKKDFTPTSTSFDMEHRGVRDFFFFFLWDWGLNSGLCVCKAGTLLLEPHLQSILFWLFWRWGLTNYFPGWPQTKILLIPASKAARITGVSHWHLARRTLFIWRAR